MKKRVSILGSTGSIGINTLKILMRLEDEFEVTCLTANTNCNLLIDQAKRFNPKSVCIVDESSYKKVKNALSSTDIEIFSGRSGLLDVSQRDNVDIVVNALVGAAGMEPTINTINAGVDVALANKESLVMAGRIIKSKLKEKGSRIFPIDSEHSAIWHCLLGERFEDIGRLILTGSGGPFRERNINEFNNISVEEALDHPNWQMGKKISIDSATMMNKGLEVIEAHWLFDFEPNQIDIVIHPQSIIHSMVELKDKSIKAQMGVPDMKIPIQFALSYPRHFESSWDALDFYEIGSLTFEKPDLEKFPCIGLAYKALDKLGSSCAALNLANDHAVNLFLSEKINFNEIAKINEDVLENHPWIEEPSLNDILELGSWVDKYLLKY